MPATRGSLLGDVALLAVAAAAILGAAAFLFVGFWMLLLLDFGRDAGEGLINSQPVVLALVLGPVVLPALAALAYWRRWRRLSLGLSAAAALPALLWLGFWLRLG